MGFFDDIVPPDAAPSDVATPPGVPRITVRPRGVEPPPGPGNAQIPADASDETDNAQPRTAAASSMTLCRRRDPDMRRPWPTHRMR
jgi:hypothetical protein